MKEIVFVQIKSALSANYKIVSGGQCLYTAEIPFNLKGSSARLICEAKTVFTIEHDIKSAIVGSFKKPSNKKRNLYIITNADGCACGSIAKIRTKAFRGYCFYELLLNDVQYIIYEIGMGNEGIKLLVFRGNVQIALIEKASTTIDNLDVYSIYLEDTQASLAVTLFNLYYDFCRFGNHGEASKHSKTMHYVYTTNRELKAKYDPMWKEARQEKENSRDAFE